MFQKFPLLQQAHDVIRTSRPAHYFESADRLSVALVQSLHISNAVELLSGTDMSALDKLFEEATSISALNQLVSEVQALTDPDLAACFHPGELTLENAVKVEVAFLTGEGFAHLEDEPWAGVWLRAWQDCMLKQNMQQLAHCSAALSADYCPPSANSFEQATAAYLDQFGETGALSVAFVGAFPFASRVDEALLAEILVSLEYLAPLLRMAQDVHVDSDETLNLGIFSTAATNRLSAREARSLIAAGKFPDLQAQLINAFQRRLDRTQRALLNFSARPEIVGFCRVCFRIAGQIAGVPAFS